MGRKKFKESKKIELVVEKQIQPRKQEQVNEEFLRLIDESIEKDKRLLKRLSRA